MDKKVITGLAVAVMLGAVALAGGYSVNPADEGAPGCLSCHEPLSDALPDGHPVVRDKLGVCLMCHGVEGTAAAFQWVVHLDHYASEDFGGDCWSCHLIDEEGRFKLQGLDKEGIEVAQEDVDRMAAYYRSWATSEHTDRAHAEAGVSCDTCHGVPFPETEAEAPMDPCIRCHGDYWDGLPELTEELNPNPHHVSHEGFLGCAECHGAHKESKNYCSNCH